MSTTRTLQAVDGHRFEIAHAAPVGRAKGGVIVLHAIYGLTSHIASVCDRWADAGYAAVAPALFDRVGPGRVHEHTREGGNAGRLCYEATNETNILSEIAACAVFLRDSGPIVVSGFCSGGSWAWVAAAKLDGIAAQVNFYGSHIASQHLALKPRCPSILHYGDSDHVVPMAEIARIRTAHPEVDLHIYPGAGHAFFNPEQEHYDAGAAALSWQRSLAFLERALAGA